MAELVVEYETGPGVGLATWTRTPRDYDSEARTRIQAVFSDLLPKRVTEISDDDFADEMVGYVPLSGAEKANGQVLRARAYLMTVMDWSADRGRFQQAGKRRRSALDVSDIRDTLDPASDDEEITGTHDRVLSVDELRSILPLLVYPAPAVLKMQTDPELDVRPLALKFILLTGARLKEVSAARWGHIDFEART